MIELRQANLKDLNLLRYWDTKQHIIDCDPDSDWNWKYELAHKPIWREQLIAELQGSPIGFIQIINPFLEETQYWGEVEVNKRAIDIWIGEEQNLNKGYGTQMMQLAIQRCFSDSKVDGILVDPLKSNRKVHRFYERLGFNFIEERCFDWVPSYVYELSRENNPNK